MVFRKPLLSKSTWQFLFIMPLYISMMIFVHIQMQRWPVALRKAGRSGCVWVRMNHIN